jgi:hypothetical protein
MWSFKVHLHYYFQHKYSSSFVFRAKHPSHLLTYAMEIFPVGNPNESPIILLLIIGVC